MYFEYVSLCLFLNWLIYLMPIYCCFYASWFRFTNWKQIKGMKTLCLVEKTMRRHFSNSCYSLHLLFCCFSFGWWFLQKKQQKKWYSFNCIYWYVTYYVLLCCIWSDVSWSLLVKWFYSESFQIMTKDTKQSQIIICHFVRKRHVVTCMLHQEQEMWRGSSVGSVHVQIQEMLTPNSWKPVWWQQ